MKINTRSDAYLSQNLEKKSEHKIIREISNDIDTKKNIFNKQDNILRIENKVASANINKINESIALLEKTRVQISNIQSQIQDENNTLNLKDISKSIQNIKFETENIFNNKISFFDGEELKTIVFSIPFENITTNKVSSSTFINKQKKEIDTNIDNLEEKLHTKLEENLNNLDIYYKNIDIDDEDKFRDYINNIETNKDIFNKNINTLTVQNEIMFLLY